MPRPYNPTPPKFQHIHFQVAPPLTVGEQLHFKTALLLLLITANVFEVIRFGLLSHLQWACLEI